jgi:outer membrane receptor protein involved in Fe transport
MYRVDNKTTLTANVINLFNQGYYTDGGSSSATPTIGMPVLVMLGAKYLF